MIAVKAEPGSSPGRISSPITRTWALEEMGRNSVRPWTRPRITASMNDMGTPRRARGMSVRGEQAPDPGQRSGAEPVAGRRAAEVWGRDRARPQHMPSRAAQRNVRERGRAPAGSAAGVLVLVVVVLVVVVVIVVLEVIEVVEVIVIIVIILVTVEDDERGGDVVRVEEGVVVRVEGGGQLLGGGVQRRVVVTSGGGSGLVVTFEGGDQRSESGARIRVHGWTVPRPTAEWTARRAASRSRSGSGRATAPDASRPSPRTGGQSDPTPHCARRGHPAREQPARAARSARRTGPPRRGLRVPDHHGAARVLGLAGARGARRAGRVRPLGACPHPGVPRRGPAHLDAATDHPGQLDTGLKVTGLSDAGTNGT